LAHMTHWDEVITRFPGLGDRDPIEDLDHGSDAHDESGFLQNLTRDRRLERLAQFERAAGQTPLPRQRLRSSFDEYNPAFVTEHDGADADDRLGRVLAGCLSPFRAGKRRPPGDSPNGAV